MIMTQLKWRKPQEELPEVSVPLFILLQKPIISARGHRMEMTWGEYNQIEDTWLDYWGGEYGDPVLIDDNEDVKLWAYAPQPKDLGYE